MIEEATLDELICEVTNEKGQCITLFQITVDEESVFECEELIERCEEVIDTLVIEAIGSIDDFIEDGILSCIHWIFSWKETLESGKHMLCRINIVQGRVIRECHEVRTPHGNGNCLIRIIVSEFSLLDIFKIFRSYVFL